MTCSPSKDVLTFKGRTHIQRTYSPSGDHTSGKYFFIIRFCAIMHRTTIVQNKIVSIIILFLPFYFVWFLFIGPVQGRCCWVCLTENHISHSIFISEEKKTFYSELIVCTTTVKIPIFNFDFHFKEYLKFVIKNLSNFVTIYIIIINYYFFKSGSAALQRSLCWCQRNSFHRVPMDDECLMRF